MREMGVTETGELLYGNGEEVGEEEGTKEQALSIGKPVRAEDRKYVPHLLPHPLKFKKCTCSMKGGFSMWKFTWLYIDIYSTQDS